MSITTSFVTPYSKLLTFFYKIAGNASLASVRLNVTPAGN